MAWLAKALEDKEKGSMFSGREFRREESRTIRERLVSDNLGVGIWSNELVLVGRVGILKLMKEIRSGQSMVEFRVLCMSLKSVLRKLLLRLETESERKTASEDKLWR